MPSGRDVELPHDDNFGRLAIQVVTLPIRLTGASRVRGRGAPLAPELPVIRHARHRTSSG